SFRCRAAQRLNLSSKKRRRHGTSGACADGSQGSSNEGAPFATRYSELIKDTPPAAPPALLRGLSRKDTGLAKAKTVYLTRPAIPAHTDCTTLLRLQKHRNKAKASEPFHVATNLSAERASLRPGLLIASEANLVPQERLALGTGSSLRRSFRAVGVVTGDLCNICFNKCKMCKTWTMLGGSGSTQELGVVPCAIAWLFRLINEHKQRTGARFSVRVSAVQVAGRSENLRDLLAEHANGTEGSGTAPGLYLRDDPVLGTKLMNYSELRAPTAEKAAFLLDAAIAAAAAANQRSEEDGRNTHFLFTLHVYQYRVDKTGRGGVAGGRSRLHLFDLGSCEKGSKAGPGAGPLSLSALGNVILALFNAQKRLPFRESKVTQLLKEALGSVTCRAAMIAHVSPLPSSYAETLATVQLASRVHRMRRKKLKYSSAASGPCGDSVEGVCRPFMRTHALNEDGGPRSGSSDPEYTSSSEQSCDTVIYVGRHQDFTDNEGPPVGGPTSLHAVLSAPTPHNSPARSSLSKTPDSPARSCNGTPATAATRPCSATAGKTECGVSAKAVRQDICSSPSVTDSPQKTSQHNSLKKVHRSPAKEITKESGANERRTSDELWIDGPRFSKPRFDSRTLQQLQKEQWVDGPAAAAAAATALYGYMDDHKKNMVERWVHEHSRYVQSPGGTKKLRSSKSGKAPQTDADSSANSTPEHRKTRAHQEHRRKNSPERLSGRESVARAEDKESTKHTKAVGTSQASRHNTEGSKGSVKEKKRDVHMVSSEEEQMESVQMQDCCLQVTEEEILAATSGWPSADDENPLPEVDQGSSNGGSQGSHPLRVLSDDGLNLPSSFTDSRSVSVDLNRVGVGDDTDFLGHVYGGLTWRLLQGTLLQRRKERRRRLYGDDLSTAVKGDVLAEKLERIARLRKLTSPYFDNNNEGIPSLLVMRSGASSPTAGRYGSLPNRKQRPLRNSFCDDNEGSTDGSDCADVTSTKSEPAEFDFDKYDIQRLNIKPMNGLKLEAFYNSIQKSNNSLMGSQDLSPPKLSPHDDALFQSYSDKLDLLAKDFGVFPNKLEPNVIDVQPQRRLSLGNANITCPEASAVVTSEKVLLYPDGFSDSSLDASGDCVSPAVCSSVRQQRRLSREGPDEEDGRTSKKEDHTPGTVEKPSTRLHRMVSTSRGSPTQRPKLEHSSPKRAVVSSPKPSRKSTSNNSVLAVPVNLKSHIQPAARPIASPTSSSCGTLTGCCSPTRSRSGAKNARQPVVTKGPCANGKHCDTKSRKGHKASGEPNSGESSDNLLYRSISTPTTPCCADAKPDEIQRAKTLEPDALPSPYATVTQARPTVRESSSGHGSSDSSSFKGVMKTIQVVQCSGTSSGYESIILRDSTPASSSQDSGSERGLKDCRGRKGSRKGVQGVSARSRSAPGRSPPQSPPVRRQPPMPGLSRHVQRWHQQHGHELRPRQPEDEVGCAGLLCCRLLDFY
ncbi:unnamed protein product, partial [Ixodes hexagonus]